MQAYQRTVTAKKSRLNRRLFNTIDISFFFARAPPLPPRTLLGKSAAKPGWVQIDQSVNLDTPQSIAKIVRGKAKNPPESLAKNSKTPHPCFSKGKLMRRAKRFSKAFDIVSLYGPLSLCGCRLWIFRNSHSGSIVNFLTNFCTFCA